MLRNNKVICEESSIAGYLLNRIEAGDKDTGAWGDCGSLNMLYYILKEGLETVLFVSSYIAYYFIKRRK